MGIKLGRAGHAPGGGGSRDKIVSGLPVRSKSSTDSCCLTSDDVPLPPAKPHPPPPCRSRSVRAESEAEPFFSSENRNLLSSNISEPSVNMCTGKCSQCIAVSLYPLALISIICNIVLFFPAGDVQYAKDGHITEEVKYMGGLIGGGVMVLIPALHIHLTGKQGCCGNRCGMFLSIAFAALGVAGALYSFAVAVLGLQNGPLCQVLLVWTTPFKDSDTGYLTDKSKWWMCTAPKDILPFHIGLFSTLLATSSLQAILCAAQMINGLFGCLCGTCIKKDVI
nr:transmembrane 4 L6 family member 5 [Nothobranchius furzeri]XP_015816403.2 transmembrane 4 L6 family member 5 [Nothobranchius furzeri]